MQRKKLLALLWLILLIALSAFIIAGCGDLKGDIKENIPPVVDFVTVPLDSSTFSYAPVVYWKGNDADGFVEYYSYADVTDNAAFADPIAFYTQIPDEAWIDTIATQARIYLRSEAGLEQEHVFYVRCFDDQGTVSEVKYRTFYRTNQPPNIPEIGLIGEDDDEMGTSVYIADTLFSGADITETWGGIAFTWRGTDPDDRSLYRIPLQFQSILVKAPGDTIFVNPWSDDLGTVLSGLETGFYTLYVWSRDDGFTLSAAPARIEFNVIKPSFERRLLMVVEAPAFPFPPADSVFNFYDKLLYDVLGPGVAADTVDVRRLNIRNTSNLSTRLSSELINQYQLIVMASDQFQNTSMDASQYIEERDKLLIRYLKVGGRLWYQGRFLGQYTMDTTNVPNYSEDGFTLLNEYLLADSLHGRSRHAENTQFYADFIETRAAIDGFNSCLYDTLKNSLSFPGGQFLPNNRGLVGAEIISRQPLAETTQYFVSYSADLDADTTNEDCTVLLEVTLYAGTFRQTVFPYPPTSTHCYLQAVHHNIYPDGVSRIFNRTLFETGYPNYIGELKVVNDNIMKISYEEGLPWADSDVLEVDYSYDPITEFHLKPVEIRYERSEYVNFAFAQLRYRTALTSFSYYFVDYPSAVHNWSSMLDWFYYPQLH